MQKKLSKNEQKSEDNNILFYIMVFALFILFKLAYVYANNSDLRFILAPTNALVSLMIGSNSVFFAESGYFYPELNIAINKDCSGVNFLLISFMAFAYLFLQHYKTALKKISAILLSLPAVYCFTILVNTSRIFVAIILQHGKLKLFPNHEGLVHEAIGIIINLSFLILAYILLERILKNKRNKYEKIT